jgi:hypothetical protein
MQVAEWREEMRKLEAAVKVRIAAPRDMPTEGEWLLNRLTAIRSARQVGRPDDYFLAADASPPPTRAHLAELIEESAAELEYFEDQKRVEMVRKKDYKKAHSMAKAGATRSEVVTYLEGLTAKPFNEWNDLDWDDCLEESAVQKVIEQINQGYDSPESIELENEEKQVKQKKYEEARREQSSLHALINDNRRMVEDGCFGVPVEDLKFKIVPQDPSNDAMYKFEHRFRSDPAYRREFLNTSYTPWSLLKLPLHVWEDREMLPRRLYSFLGTSY